MSVSELAVIGNFKNIGVEIEMRRLHAMDFDRTRAMADKTSSDSQQRWHLGVEQFQRTGRSDIW